MREVLIFLIGALVGGWISQASSLPGQRGSGPIAYLNGGMISSSTIGVIYGYVDDMEGCNIHAAGMNFYYQSDEATRKRVLAAKGNAYCSWESVK